MDFNNIDSAGLPPPSSPRPQRMPSPGPDSTRRAYHHDDDFLPPITTDTLPTALQTRIACQPWDKVSAREPIGSHEHAPDEETFYEFASAILEMRLADVVKDRRDNVNKLSSSLTSPRISTDECLTKVGGGQHDSSSPSPSALRTESSPTVLLTSNCRSQLRAYVRRIASMYRDNRYHALEHAIHVTMSANKLLDMIHDGTAESSSDVDEMNDFSMSEPCIMKEMTSDLDRSTCDSINSLLSENGYKYSRGLHSGASMVRNTSLSEDFDSHALGPTKEKRPKAKRSGPSTHLVYSDTLTKFAFVFAAMIHDVDHQGVPNTRLLLENDPIVEVHGGISVAEKHSIKVAFQTLSEDGFDEFRSVVFESPDDQLRLHRIVTNVVVSTDIASPERMRSTKIRWEEAFCHHHPNTLPTKNGPAAPSSGRPSPATERIRATNAVSPSSEIATVQASKPRLVSMRDTTDELHARHERRHPLTKRVVQHNGGQRTVEYFPTERHGEEEDDETRAALRHSVIIETMLNVADVAHSMQSWELFLFWNRKLFEELYVAFKTGRSGNDPSNDWYQNQLGFYKLYVIPLAEKMKTCGVFGERGGEWVENAISIRDRWCREGDQETKDMIAAVERDIERCYP